MRKSVEFHEEYNTSHFYELVYIQILDKLTLVLN